MTQPKLIEPPELLAPAGDETCMIAAVENGADAIYFGLKGHNARARAANFAVEDLTRIMATLHRRGVKGYVTLNTLIFPSELEQVETIVRDAVEAGVDALIVQDIGLARLIRAVSPDIEIHASTQMSVTSAEGVRLAKELGCSRVILARELSLREIAKIKEKSELPVEVFVHGALCVAYSGQCLTSEALGGRSANRGECAQACRMPYDVVRDGEIVDLGDMKYLLSPQDLAAFDLVPQLVEIGVASLKIEGRLKSPEYVANITKEYRLAIDAAVEGMPSPISEKSVHDMQMSFSRGFSHGFFDGDNHKILVRGDYAKKRGVFLGRVTAIRGDRVRIDLAAPIKAGDGVVFDGDEREDVPEQGGRVYEVFGARGNVQNNTQETPTLSAGPADLSFGRRDIDLRRIQVGQRVWKTDDPELSKRLRASFEGAPHRLTDLDVSIFAKVGEPLVLEGRTATGFSARVQSERPLERAERLAANEQELRAQVDRLGGTIYRLREFVGIIEGEPLVPKSLLNGLRRELVGRLDELAFIPKPRAIAEDRVLPILRGSLWEGHSQNSAKPSSAELATLCRTIDQVEASVRAGVSMIYLDFQDIKRLKDAIDLARGLGEKVQVFAATPRIQKPGESPIFRHLARLGADGLLVRNAGGLLFCADRGVKFVADFSLNASNELSVELLRGRGAIRVTASYDLSAEQLDDLQRGCPPGVVEVVIHQQMPMFHMEHCVFCAVLSPGTDKTNCGRPCDVLDVRLRDRVGMEHPLKADVGCRNTLFNAVPQTAAEYLPRLIARGASVLRVEFLDDSSADVTRILKIYGDAIQGKRDARSLWKDLKATNRYGVTRGQLAVL